MNAELLKILVCPKTKQPLLFVDGSLVSPAAKLRFRIENDVPVLLVEEATAISDAELARYLKP